MTQALQAIQRLRAKARISSKKTVKTNFEIIPEVAASSARVLKPVNLAAMGIVNSFECNASTGKLCDPTEHAECFSFYNAYPSRRLRTLNASLLACSNFHQPLFPFPFPFPFPFSFLSPSPCSSPFSFLPFSFLPFCFPFSVPIYSLFHLPSFLPETSFIRD